ncbi:kinase-like domain-containing protein [Cyathus striatus]|nr:kinase-like domain-containing protein [Cyathus striatus]
MEVTERTEPSDDAPKDEKELLIGAFSSIFQDKLKFKPLLGFQGEKAQIILDALQILLDHKQGSSFLNRAGFMRALLRLSKSGFAIAEGHFGEVWKGTSVVLKAYHNSDISKLRNAYRKEAILWSQLSHPNVLPFYGVHHLGDELGRICLVSPWMDNGNINVYLKRYPDANRLYLLKEIARGISYLHDENINIVHGDLKGANILVTSSGRPCLGDFGLSSMTDSEVLKWSSLQSTVTTGGTTRWQAPELFDPAVDHAILTKESDVYAFGCVFTGEVPFYEIPREAAVIYRIIKGEKPSRPDLESRTPKSVFFLGLTEEIWTLMQDCWKFDPTERLNINEVLKKIPTNYTDPRPGQSWEGLSSAQFRKTMENKFNRFSSGYDVKEVLELLGEL